MFTHVCNGKCNIRFLVLPKNNKFDDQKGAYCEINKIWHKVCQTINQPQFLMAKETTYTDSKNATMFNSANITSEPRNLDTVSHGVTNTNSFPRFAS